MSFLAITQAQATLAHSLRIRFVQQSCNFQHVSVPKSCGLFVMKKLESFRPPAEQPIPILERYYSKGSRPSFIQKFDTNPSNRQRDSDLVRRLASFKKKSIEELVAFLGTLSPRSFDYNVVEMSLRVSIHLIETKRFTPHGSAEKKTVLNSKGMRNFLKSNTHILDANLLLLNLKLLTVLGIDTHCNNATVVLIMKMLLKEVNLMGLDEIDFLNRMLHRLGKRSSSLATVAVKQILPILAERYVLLLLDRSHNTKELSQCLAYAVQNKCSDTMVAKILTNIQKQGVYNTQDALRILWALLDLGVSVIVNRGDGLLQSVFELLAEHIDSIELNELRALLTKCAGTCTEGRNYCYHSVFLDAGMNRLLKTGDERIILDGFRVLSAMKHNNVKLLEIGAEIILSNPRKLLGNAPLFCNILKTYAELNYKPRKWDALRLIFLRHPATVKRFQKLSKQDISLICNFLILGELPIPLMESYRTIDTMCSSGSHYDIQRALVFNAVKQLFPQYHGPFPSASKVAALSNSMKEFSKKFVYPLKETLHEGLGGESYVITGLIHNGLHVDHCIVLSSGGQPVCQTMLTTARLEEIKGILKISDSVLLKVKNSMQYTVHVRLPEAWVTDVSLSASDIVCYTDGSKAGASSGIGVHIEYRDKDICCKIHSDSVSLGRDATVFQCEVFAILYAAECLLSAKCVDRAISFFSDSIECVDALKGPATTSSLVLECYKKLNELANDNLVDIHIIPGNRGFRGNEEADRLAKAGVKSLDMLQRPSNSVLILIRLVPPTAYIRNTKQLRGCYALEKKILETYGCPMFVNSEKFQQLRSPDKLTYLLQKIREVHLI